MMTKSFMEYLEEANPRVAEILNSGFEENKKLACENNKIELAKKSAEVFGDFIKTAADNKVKDIPETSFTFLPRDWHIKDEMFKMARLDVQDTTPEGIEQFLKEFMYNELSYFPDKLDINITIIPIDVAPKNPKQYDMTINNATGTVDINYKGALIQIPFMLRDKEILPFDTIQMGAESAVYTRDNMRNILLNLKGMSERKVDAGPIVNENRDIESYVGVEKPYTLTTDTGFMGDMLQIQTMLGQNSSPHYVHAAAVNDLLEKTANIKKVSVDYRGLEAELKRRITPEAEKLASADHVEDEDSRLEKKALLDQFNDEVVADVQILDNGDFFLFTEKDGMSITETVGVIFKVLSSVEGVLDLRLVITADGRLKLLKPGEGFLFNLTKTDELPPLKLKKINISSLNSGRMYTANIGGTQLLPFIVMKSVSGGEKGIKVPMIYYCTDIRGNQFTLVSAPDVGENQMTLISKDKMMNKAAITEEANKLPMYNVLFKKDMPILCLAETTEFLKLNIGEINNISSRKDYMFLYDGNVKLAAFGDKVMLILVNGDPKSYTLVAVWVDRRSGMDRRVELENISEDKVISALKNLGYDFDKISQAVYQANREGYAELNIAAGIAPWKLEPEVGAGMAAVQTIKDLKSSLFSKDNAKKAVADIFGGALSGLFEGSSTGRQVADLKAFASESRALAEKLEKVAVAKESQTFTKLAGMMVIKNRVDEMMAGALEGGEYKGTEVLADIHTLSPYMSKLAHDLVELKLQQAFYKDEIISPNVINATLRHLDGLHKYATAFKKD